MKIVRKPREVPKVFSYEKYAKQAEEVREANANGKSDTLIVLMTTGNSGEREGE
jgi:hypothetical protein